MGKDRLNKQKEFNDLISLERCKIRSKN